MWLQRANYDVILLQETHCHLKRHEKQWGLEWGGQSVWSRGTNRSRGVAVLFKRNVNFHFKTVLNDPNGRYIVFDLYCNDVKYRFINIYAPNDEHSRIMFFNNIGNFLTNDCENLVTGDFNCTLSSTIDRKNCTNSNDKGQSEIKEVMDTFDLEDIWRRRNPDKTMFSWQRQNKGSRIDYWVISKSLDNQVDQVEYITCPFSDHKCNKLEFRTVETEIGKGIWKMNEKTIKSELFQKCFRSWWQEWKKEKVKYDNLNIWWDIAKKKIKNMAVTVSISLRKDLKGKLDKLERELDDIAKRVDFDSSEVIAIRNELLKLYDEKSEGAIIRSRAKWFEEGEKPTRYFHNLEKRNAKDKVWDKIISKEQKVVQGTRNIIKEQVRFYEQLYKAELTDTSKAECFLSKLDKGLSDNSKKILDDNITIEELSKALHMMKNNKSPGSDGIIIEFYKLFWGDIKYDLLEVFVNSYENESLPYTQYQAVIRLLFKKGKREDLRNWRPISLLNSDVKILSKLLANRLKKVLSEIIHTDQTGCIEGRFIGQNVRLIDDIIENSEKDEVILMLDQEKAFDRVEWDWLYKVLSKFGFGKNFVKWLNIMYKNMKSSILTNGYLSKYFSISRGIRQGDSLSALLYVIQAEPLASYLRQTNRIKGITVGITAEVRTSQYVDDTVVCLQHAHMVNECLKIIDEYGKASGSRVNKGKTVGLVMNENTMQKNPELDIILTPGPVRFLGIPVGKVRNENEFWNNVIAKIEKIYNIWKARDLSLLGRVHIIKSLGMSTVMFASNMMNIGEKIMQQIEKLNYSFLWHGTNNLMKKEICTLPRLMGGLGMFDLSIAVKSQRVRWVRRILQNNKNESWKIMPLSCFKCLDIRFGTELFALSVNDCKNLLNQAAIPMFYKQCLLDFQELCQKAESVTQRQVIWCNNRIKFNGEQ
jgi:exonuclease III